MGYGKRGKKSKHALQQELDEYGSQRTYMIVGIVIGVVLVIASLLLQMIAQGGVFDESIQMAVMIGAFIGLAIGVILVAICVIKMGQVNEELRRVKKQLGK